MGISASLYNKKDVAMTNCSYYQISADPEISKRHKVSNRKLSGPVEFGRQHRKCSLSGSET